MLLTPDSDGSGSVVIRSADGLDLRFGLNPDGTYAAPEGRFATLTPASGGGWTLADKDRTVYAFDGGGRVTTITDRDGRAETFAYSSGRLATVTNTTSGRSLHFTWTGSHVTSVATDSLGTAGPLTWTYTYSGGQLARVCGPTSACTGYASGPGSHYRSAVLDSSPHSYWRMGSPASTAGAPSTIADAVSRSSTGTWATDRASGRQPASPCEHLFDILQVCSGASWSRPSRWPARSRTTPGWPARRWRWSARAAGWRRCRPRRMRMASSPG
jgi:YD repeat-containing protein